MMKILRKKTKKIKIKKTQNKNIGVAVSGGIDSMVLLHLLKITSVDLGFNLYALHFNHKWRKSSGKDYKLISKVCNKLGVKLFYGHNTSGIINNEEAARKQRYSFFEQIAMRENLDYVATAHHKDDVVETVLFRLIRGTGPNGLYPIKTKFLYSNNLKIFRPLLSFSKNDLIDYAKENNIPFLDDETNKNIEFKRNLIREKIIPLLRMVNNSFENNLLTFSDLVYSQGFALSDYFNEFRELILFSDSDCVEISKKIFLSMPIYSQKSIIYWMMSKINLKGNFIKNNEILLSIKQNKKISLSKSIFLISNNHSIYLGPDKIEKQSVCKISIRKVKPNEFRNIFPKDSTGTAFVDLSMYNVWNLKVRTRSPKDVFQPLGINKVVKLKNYLINKKILRDQRYNLSLLCDGDEILWIPGYAISEKIKVKNKPTHFLKLVREGL